AQAAQAALNSPPGSSAPPGTFAIDARRLETLTSRMRNPLLFGFFMLQKLPLGFCAGLRVKSADERRCETTVPYGWRTQNPFKSTYFAAQSMAAELSTGVLAMLATDLAPASVAMLIVDLEASFGKKATGTTTFTCEDGDAIFAAVQRALETGEAQTVRAETVGRMPDGTEVSRFAFTWSFKKRSR
ncbi:MAG: DUF4442 domain-containing protein, partial [Acidobacteriota bacterium]